MKISKLFFVLLFLTFYSHAALFNPMAPNFLKQNTSKNTTFKNFSGEPIVIEFYKKIGIGKVAKDKIYKTIELESGKTSDSFKKEGISKVFIKNPETKAKIVIRPLYMDQYVIHMDNYNNPYICVLKNCPVCKKFKTQEKDEIPMVGL